MRCLHLHSIVLGLVLAVAGAVHAQAPADGVYEEFPSILMRPVGPVLGTPPTDRPFVEVATVDRTTTVTFAPERRVVWRITWGPNGPVEKVTLVDGEEWTRSQFAYDADGHLATKTVTGPGVPTTVVYAYRTDADGHVVERTGLVPRRIGVNVAERITVARSARGLVVTTSHAGVEVRRDVRDPSGLVRETRLYREGQEIARLTYQRAAGALHVRRRIGTLHGLADPTHPDPHLQAEHVGRLSLLVVDRHEAALLLGAPTRSTDAGRGAHRETSDDWSGDACWLNAMSGIEWDPTGLARNSDSACICGFCVDASLPAEIDPSETVLATDLHWTRGPWIRLEGRVDVTGDHEVMTPGGPVRADRLAIGDVVLAADGSPITLTSVERLPEGELRLGRNLRTSDGTFAAGRLLFASEVPRACTP